MRIVPVLVLLVACGGGGGADDDDDDDVAIDAATGSDATDAIPADASPPDGPLTLVPVQVRVNDVFEPDPDPTAMVWFSAADGTVTGQGTVNAAGVLDGMVPAGGNVTIRRNVPFNGNHWSTVVGLESGDVVRFGVHLGAPQGQMTFRLPASANESYFVDSSCSPEGRADPGANQPVTISARLFDCGAKATFVFTSYGFGGAPTSTIVAEDVTIAPGTTVDLAGPWLPNGPRSVQVANFPGTAAYASAIDIHGDQVSLVAYDTMLNGSTVSWTGATVDGVEVRVSPSGPGFSHTQGFAHGTALSTIDATPRLPTLSGFTSSAGTMRWNLTGAGPSDLVHLNGFMAAARWEVVMPPGTTSFVIPQVPGFLQLNPRVSVIDASTAPSYAQIRAWFLGNRERGLFGTTLPSTYSVQMGAAP